MLNNQKRECNFKLNFPTFFSARSSTTGRLFQIPNVSPKVHLLKYMNYSFPIPILVAVIERMLLSVHSIPQALQYSNEVKVPIACTVTFSKHINLLVPISSIKFKSRPPLMRLCKYEFSGQLSSESNDSDLASGHLTRMPNECLPQWTRVSTAKFDQGDLTVWNMFIRLNQLFSDFDLNLLHTRSFWQN